ncbi:MAG: threonine/serine dehydratase [Proteobacteria bacterium]|nr:threonine/serine dehydratase [Pseudomonadota bacterium]
MTVTLEDISQAAARLQGVAIKTPLLQSHVLNERLGAEVFLKPECLQHIGAFKFRGAYNRICQLSDTEKSFGVVAYSSGNHAQGVAYAAKLLGLHATIVMPTDAPTIKIEGTEKLGAVIRFYDRHSESREDIAAEIAESTGAILIPAFDDVDIIAGQGTAGLELMQQLADNDRVPDSVLSPCGGGGLLAGVSTAVKALHPQTRVYGVEPENFDDHRRSKLAGKRVRLDGSSPTLCDALMAMTPGEITWSINSRTVDDFLVVSEDEVAYAVSYAFRHLKLVVEPGGAAALAALLGNKLEVAGETVGLVLSGGNMDAQTLHHCLQHHAS